MRWGQAFALLAEERGLGDRLRGKGGRPAENAATVAALSKEVGVAERTARHRIAQAADEQQAATWMNYAWVCSSVQISLRKEILTYKHHEVVAPLEPPEQQRWLDEAIENKWSVHQLRVPLRRHLLAGQKCALRLEFLELSEAWHKQQAAARERRGGDRRSAKAKDQKGNVATMIPRTRESLAAAAKVSPRTAQDALTLRKAAPEKFKAVSAGKLSLSRSAGRCLSRSTKAGAGGRAMLAGGCCSGYSPRHARLVAGATPAG